MARRSYPDFLARLGETRDHPSADVGLPGSGRSLDRQYASLKLGSNAHRRGQHRLTWHIQRLAIEPGRLPEQQAAASAVTALAANALIRYPFANPHQAFREHGRINHVVRENGIRMHIRAVAALLDLNDTLIQRDPINGSQLLAAGPMQGFPAP